MLNSNKITFEGIDLFAGAGGVTTGIESAMCGNKRIAFVRAAINHDPVALASHAKNHKEAIHFKEDIRDFDVTKLPQFLNRENKIIYIWASLECTNFSNAKGGLPRDPDSRTLANHLFKYIDHVQPDYIFIENVREFMAWGDLCENGKPVSRTNGVRYLKWVEKVKGRGYSFSKRLLNAADFGAHTSRIRLFIIFSRKGMPVRWPEPTHSKTRSDFGAFGKLKPWKPVRQVLNLDDTGKSIFKREKPLVERTLKRIYAGLKKYTGEDNGVFLQSYYGNGHSHDVSQPCPTLITKDRFGKLSTVRWLDKRYNGSHNHQTLNAPAATLTTTPKLALVAANWIDKQYSSDLNHQSLACPASTLTANPKLALVRADSFIMPTNYDNSPKSLNEPIPTITANRKWHYLVNPQFKNMPSSIENPCFTLIARMDKKPPSIITAECGKFALRVNAKDTPTMIEIKKFMAARNIVDIKMRMLSIPELKRITGFSDDYVLLGSQADQKKFIGNAVPPVVPQKIFEAIHKGLREVRAYA